MHLEDPAPRPPLWLTFALCAAGLVLILLSFACAPKPEPLPPKVPMRDLITLGEVRIATGRSMEPLFGADYPETAAFLAVVPTPYNDLKRGHVVIYRGERNNIVHRLGQQTRDGWVVYGLNNERRDPVLLTPGNYIARVVAYSLPE